MLTRSGFQPGTHTLGTVQAVAQGSFSATLEAMRLLLILEIASRDSILSAVRAVD